MNKNGLKYFATFLIAVAVYNGPGMNLTWLNVNVAPHYRRATAIGFQQTLGNTGMSQPLELIADTDIAKLGPLQVKFTGSRRTD